MSRERGTGGGRALSVALLLGGFLALAFVLCGQAHAAAPESPSVLSAPATGPALADSVTRGAEQGATEQAADGGRDVTHAVAAATAGPATDPVTGLIDAVTGVTHQVTTPVVQAVGPVVPVVPVVPVGAHSRAPGHHVADHRCSVATRTARPAPAGPRSTTAARTRAGHHAARPAPHALPRQRAGGQAAPAAAAAPAVPVRTPGVARHSGHPVDGDGTAHHTGGTNASGPAAGAHVHHDAAARAIASGSTPLRRASDVSVQPD
ncbi:hypothetical protein [Streptantibioticus silvisoli]|uniref:Uncharacterized protein n=1 Tax=Streptantibioticus silvisoli TaxID=2705255 RepID=A0ABT6W538_9ACTN|nr:hypothetical protein [Streptantibioticus silvisoli]MDI5965855.1 hypothetical protein [Streptantibioticus silvisoli]